MSTSSHSYRKITTLAWPIVLSHMGHMMASIADAIMAGQLGTVPQAAVGFCDAVYAVFVLFGIGIAVGMTPLVAKAVGQKNEDGLSSLYKHGLVMNILTGVILSILMLGLMPFLKFMGQSPEVLDQAIPYYILLGSSIIFSLIFFHFKQFGEGIHLVKGTMWVTIWGNLLNILLNFFFIKGWFGLPEMGITGLGLATFIARGVMMFALILSFRKSRMRAYIDRYRLTYFKTQKLKFLFQNCIPVGFQYILEMSAFSVAAVMSGWFGPTSLASHYVAIKVASVTYLIAAGLSSASSILVGNAYGEKNWEKLKSISIMSTKMILVIMTILAIIIVVGQNILPRWFNPDPQVILLSSKLLIIAAIFQLFDGLQVVGMGILRGINDLKMPTYIAFFAYWIVAVPLCYLLSTSYEMGAVGVWIGLLVGLFLSSSLIFWRIRNQQALFTR